MKKFIGLILGLILSAVLWSCNRSESNEDSSSSQVSSSVKILNAEFEDGALDKKIVITGFHSSDVPVSKIEAFHEPVGDSGSNSVESVAKVSSDGIFNVESDLKNFRSLSGKYKLRIVAYYENGKSSEFSYDYSFSGEKPNLSTIKTQTISTKSWKAVYASSENLPNNPKENIVDGNVSTYWHSRWSNGYDKFPFELIVDMATKTNVEGFSFYTRTESTHGTIEKFDLFKSDDRSNWTKMGTFNLKKQSKWQYVVLSGQQSMRYVKIVINSSHRTNEENSLKETYTHLSELGAF